MKRQQTESKPTIRPAAVAGRFYPEDPDELRETIKSLLAEAETEPCGTAPPWAIIAPHAGYIYSGSIAASAYATWKGHAENIKRVVLMGPAHFVDTEGILASSAGGFETPLGVVRVDTQAIGRLLEKGLVTVSDAAHAREHSLEVHLPFLQVLLGDFTCIPLLAGDTDPRRVAAVLEEFWTEGTRVVISSDLSHYLDWASARRLDLATAEAVEHLLPDSISPHQACGQVPVRGLLLAARKHQLRTRTLDLRNSGDTAGPREQVVGYGAFAFTRQQELVKEH